MKGTKIQLERTGIIDSYFLSGNPQMSFFKAVYRKHTNFAVESIEQTYNGNSNFNKRITVTISRSGDLVSGMYIQADLSGGDPLCANAGHALIDSCELKIGGKRIDKQSGLWMEIHSELTEENKERHTGTIESTRVDGTVESTRVNGTVFQNMACAGGVKGKEGFPETDTMYVPLRFWFCRNPALALPLISLQNDEVKINITLAEKNKIFSIPSNAINTQESNDINKFTLWADYIHLGDDERRKYENSHFEIPIELVQFFGAINITDKTTRVELKFNYPVKELIWVKVDNSDATFESSHVTPLSFSTTSKAVLQLEGEKRFVERPMTYFTRTQIYQHHSGNGGVINNDSIAVYSFALKPEEYQPTGTCNLTRIDNATLIIKVETISAGQSFEVFAVNYNILVFREGLGGLRF